MIHRILALVVGVLILASVAVAGSRTWTNRTGLHRIEAEMVGYEKGTVELQKSDGTLVKVPLNKFSTEDQQFVRMELRRQREAGPSRDELAGTEDPPSAAGTAAGGSWSQWRGPQRDGHSTETGLLNRWPEEGPPLAWQANNLGSGYSSVVVADGRVFTMGTRDGAEQLIAVDASSGQELWSAPVGRGDHSNCTPTVDGELVFAVGLQGDLVCAEASTGRELWRRSFADDFGGQMMSGWGYSESPLVDGDRLICTPGSRDAMMAALDKQTGRPLWTTPIPGDAGNRGKEGAGYSSIVVSTAGGVRQYVQLVGKGLISVAADSGRLLWGYNRIANNTANIPTPITRGDYVFCSTGYQTGAALLQVGGAGGQVSAEEVYFLDHTQLQNHHGGMLLVGDFIYCGHGHNKGFPVCVELATGRTVWGPERGPGGGSAAVAYADGHLYFRYEDGVMALIEATPEGYNLKGQFRIASRHDKSWPHPVIVDGRLYLRDQHQLHCYDIRK